MPQTAPEQFSFDDDGSIPNNPRLPVLVHRGAFTDSEVPASAMKARFAENGWGNSWRDGIYDFHHYHSTAHEVLGVAAGTVTIRLGGERGSAVELAAGDVVVIPAGVGHKCEQASEDFVVIGAYDANRDWDLRHGEAKDRPEVIENIADVPDPERDPVTGGDYPG
jgi:uncharacterized protein YjlB